MLPFNRIIVMKIIIVKFILFVVTLNDLESLTPSLYLILTYVRVVDGCSRAIALKRGIMQECAF